MRYTMLLVLTLAAACTRAPGATPPVAEFLVAAGDSTYWVTSGPEGVRVRASSIMLARYAGRFHELFVTDDDRSYEDALLVGQGVYSRDLMSGDSTLVFADTLVGRIAREYAAAHPDAAPLPPDDPGPDRPSTSATSDVSFLDVHGPFLSIEYRARTRKRGSANVVTAWHAVVDLRRSGQRSLDDLLGGQAATRILAQGRRSFAHAVDSAHAVAASAPALASAALAALKFDSQSFALSDSDGVLAVEFAARVSGGRAGGALLPLPKITADEPAWWTEVRSTLPTTVGDAEARWRHGRYEVVAMSDTSGETAQVSLVDSAHHSWDVRRMPTPVQHVFWLDSGAADSATHASLRRAFDEAARYDGGSIALRAVPQGRVALLPVSR